MTDQPSPEDSAQTQRINWHEQNLARIDARLITIDTRLDNLNQLLSAWTAARGFITTISTLADVIRPIIWAAAGAAALWLFTTDAIVRFIFHHG